VNWQFKSPPRSRSMPVALQVSAPQPFTVARATRLSFAHLIVVPTWSLVDDIETILEATPRTQQSIFFSATMPRQIQRIAERYLTNPVQIKIESKTATADSITQTCVFVSGREKDHANLRIRQWTRKTTTLGATTRNRRS